MSSWISDSKLHLQIPLFSHYLSVYIYIYMYGLICVLILRLHLIKRGSVWSCSFPCNFNLGQEKLSMVKTLLFWLMELDLDLIYYCGFGVFIIWFNLLALLCYLFIFHFCSTSLVIKERSSFYNFDQCFWCHVSNKMNLRLQWHCLVLFDFATLESNFHNFSYVWCFMEWNGL